MCIYTDQPIHFKLIIPISKPFERYSEIRGLSNQGGQENLSGAIIKEIKVSYPSLLEQEK